MKLGNRDVIVTTREWHRDINGKNFRFKIVEYPKAVYVSVHHETIVGLPSHNPDKLIHSLWFYKKRSN